MKLLKWIVGLVLGLVLLVVIAAIAASYFIDEEALKKQVVTRFEAQIGHSLRIDGPLQLSFFPWVGVALGELVLGNAPGFAEQPLAMVRELDVKVGIMPLLEKRVAVDTVVLKGVALNLERNAQGQGNWESLAAGGKKDRKPAEKRPKKDDGEFMVELKGLELEDLDLHYIDRQSGAEHRLDDLAVRIGELVPGKVVPLEASMNLKSSAPAMTLAAALSTDLTYTGDYQRIDLSALALELDAKGEGLPGEGVKLKLAADVALDQAAGKLAVSDFSLSGLNVDVTGAVSISDLEGAPRVEGKLALQQTNLKELLQLAGVVIETADPEALTQVSGDIRLVQQGASLMLKPLVMKLDDSTLEGHVEVASFEGPVVRANLKLDAIDLDRYLPPASEAQKSPPAKENGDPGKKTEKPDFTALRKLNLDANFHIGKLKVSNLKMDSVALKLRAKQGVINLDPAQAALYGGKFLGSSQLDVRKETPRIKSKEALSGIQVGPLLKDLTGEERLTGTGNVKIDIVTRGQDDVTIKRNLNGSLSFEFKDGAYKGFNIAHEIRKAQAAISGKTISDNEPQETDFAELRASALIKQGVITNKDLYLASPVLRVNGEGDVDLVKEKVDYLVTTKIVGTLKGQGGGSVEQLKGVAVPVRIKGGLADPSLSVDMQAALKANAEQQLEEKTEELKGKARKKLEEKMGSDLLKGIFGR